VLGRQSKGNEGKREEGRRRTEEGFMKDGGRKAEEGRKRVIRNWE
jgi:hypothetical protein